MVADARAVEYVSVSVSVSVSKLETLLHGNDDFRSTNEVELLIVLSLSNTRA